MCLIHQKTRREIRDCTEERGKKSMASILSITQRTIIKRTTRRLESSSQVNSYEDIIGVSRIVKHFTAVLMKIQVFWDITPCDIVNKY
jgi:hypothetical protein